MAVTVLVLVALPAFRPSNAPVIQLAMLDTVGTVRGSETNEATLLREAWQGASLESFSNLEALRVWERRQGTQGDMVRIVYDRAAAEVRVAGTWRAKAFERRFPLDPDLPTALVRVKEFLAGRRRDEGR